MALGVTLLTYTAFLKWTGYKCDTSYFHIMVSFAIYISFFVLHSNSLYTKYLRKEQMPKKKE